MSKQENKKKRRTPYRVLIDEIREDKKAFTVFAILNVTIFAIILRNIYTGHFENVFTGALAALLLLIPPFVERRFRVKLPTTLEVIAYVFVFAAEILGEIGNFYQIFPFWDAMLHTVNGFIFAAFGFCLVDIFNKSKRFRFVLSPIFLAVVAFCFSMTIGVLWEFFEYTADTFLQTDMQKDVLRDTVSSVSIPNDLGEKVTHVTDVTKTVIYTADGQTIELEGYLDVGIADTMKDLFVNLIGAAAFSIIGYFYVRHRGRGAIAGQFIPVFKEANEEENAPPHSPKEPKKSAADMTNIPQNGMKNSADHDSTQER